MIREKIKAWFGEEKSKLIPMSPKKRWEYIWTYYKWWILAFVLLVYIVVSGVENYRYQSREILVSGVFINTATSAEGYAFVSDGYWSYAGADSETRVELIEARYIRYNVEQPTSDDVNAILSIDTQIAAKTLDYIIGDASAMAFYDNQASLLNLETLFTPEQLSRWKTVQTKNGTVAIDLSNSKLAREFELQAEPAYIFFPANTPRAGNCAAFVAYLFSE